VCDFDVLLVLRNDGTLLPVFRGAFSAAEGWPWSIKKQYIGALVVGLEGVATIAEVNVVGPAGNSALSKTLGVLNSNWRVAVRLKANQMGVESIVEAVRKGLRSNMAAGRALFDLPEGELLSRLIEVASVTELFNRLGVDKHGFVALDSL